MSKFILNLYTLNEKDRSLHQSKLLTSNSPDSNLESKESRVAVSCLDSRLFSTYFEQAILSMHFEARVRFMGLFYLDYFDVPKSDVLGLLNGFFALPGANPVHKNRVLSQGG